MIKYRFVFVVFLICCFCSMAFSEEQDKAGAHECLDFLIEISESVDSKLQSYEAEGRLREYDIVDGNFNLVKDARVIAKCSKGLYYLNFEFDQNINGYDRRVIIYDGSSVGTSRFGPGISVTSAEGDIFAVRPSRAGLVCPQLAGFPWDIAHLHRDPCYLPLLIENLGIDRVSCIKTSNGDIKVGYLIGRSGDAGKVELLYGKKDGFHLISKDCYNTQNNKVQSFNLKWIQIDGVWCVQRFIEESLIANKKWEMEFKDIIPNSPVDEKYFTLASLDLPGGARIIDRSTKINENPIHFTPVSEEVIVASTKQMIDQVKSLPDIRESISRDSGFQGKNSKSSFWFILFLVNVMIIMGIILVFVRKKKSKKLNHSE